MCATPEVRCPPPETLNSPVRTSASPPQSHQAACFSCLENVKPVVALGDYTVGNVACGTAKSFNVSALSTIWSMIWLIRGHMYKPGCLPCSTRPLGPHLRPDSSPFFIKANHCWLVSSSPYNTQSLVSTSSWGAGHRSAQSVQAFTHNDHFIFFMQLIYNNVNTNFISDSARQHLPIILWNKMILLLFEYCQRHQIYSFCFALDI